MKEVYIVTSGDYSDYSIRQVFDDKEIAEEFAAQISGDVEIYEITNELKYAKGLRCYTVSIPKDGNIIRVNVTDINAYDWAANQKLMFYPHYTKLGQSGYYAFMYVLTDMGEEGAIKIANEKRAMAIANNQWPE